MIKEGIEKLLEVSQAPFEILNLEGVGISTPIMVAIDPSTRTAKLNPLGDLLDNPLYRESCLEFHEVDSFIDYVNRFKTNEAIILFSEPLAQFTCIFDFHPAGPDTSDAGRRKDKVTLTLQHSDEYCEWSQLWSKPSIKQLEFATFLEEHANNIISPDSAAVLEAALDMRVSSEGHFESKIVRETGSFTAKYSNDNKQVGSVTLPRHIYISIPIWNGGEPKEIRLATRFDVRDGVAVFSLFPGAVKSIVRQDVTKIRQHTSEATGVPVFA